MDASCTIQDSIHVFNLVHKYVSSILGTYHFRGGFFLNTDFILLLVSYEHERLIMLGEGL